MHHYSLTAFCFFLVAQAAPLSVRKRTIFDNPVYYLPLETPKQDIPPYSYFPSFTQDPPPPPDLPTKDQLFALTPSSETQQPQNLNTIPFYTSGDTLSTYSILPPPTAQSNILPPINGIQMIADVPSPKNGNQPTEATPTYVAKNCDNPGTCKLCKAADQDQCSDAEVSTDSNNSQKGKICPVGSAAEDQCITYLLYGYTGECVSGDNSNNCRLCHPNNPENCVSAEIQSKAATDDLTIRFICPRDKGTGVYCIQYDSVTRCTSPDGTKC
ncbi:hypothetical protein MMC22_004107 [Lobaria immixta]|nr:hypothetical protein [Lobaria immixta]